VEIFEYIAVLTSIIIGLGMAHLLRGLVRLIQHPDRHPVYWVHLGWVLYLFFTLVFWWWWEFRLGTLETWTFLVYFYIVFYAFVLFIVSALLFPDDLIEYGDYKSYFYARRGWFFGLLALTFLIDPFDSLLKGKTYFMSLGTEYFISVPLQTGLCIAAIFVSNERYHQALVVAFLIYQVSWAVRGYPLIVA
jgi:hypothetical protein